MAKLGEYCDKLPHMSADEVALVASKHLLEQKRTSERYNAELDVEMCSYKGEGGICCAAAPFIKNYTPEMENNSWYKLVSKFDQSSNHKELICDLQRIHDMKLCSEWFKELSYSFGNSKFPKTMVYLNSVGSQYY